MSDEKIAKGIYYSCEHQQFSKDDCQTCKKDQETEREKLNKLEQEYKIKKPRYLELAEKSDNQDMGGKFSDAEEKELKELTKWGSENLAHEYWDGSRHISGGQLGALPGANMTEVIGCKVCGEAIVKHQQITPTTADRDFKKVDYNKLNPKQNKYEVLMDCYKDDEEYTCFKHQQSNISSDDSNQIKSNQIKSNQIKSNQIKSNYQQW